MKRKDKDKARRSSSWEMAFGRMENRGTARWLAEWVRGTIRALAEKIREKLGRPEPTLEHAQRLWDRAFRAAEQHASHQTPSAPLPGPETPARYSIREEIDSSRSGEYTEEATGMGDIGVPTVEYNGEERPVYRGGVDFTVKSNEVKINLETGNVKTTHGVSLDVNPETVSKFGGAYKIESLPEGLKIIQRGARPEHFEIVPEYEMPLETFQELLNQIGVSALY